MAYSRRAADRGYPGGGGSNSGRSSDRGRDAGGSRPSGGAGRVLDQGPPLTATWFLSDKEYSIHRDVLKIRIRQLLGSTARSWVGIRKADGAPGNYYCAETTLTEPQIEDLERETIDYRRDPKAFQNRLNRDTWDHSQFTDPGEPGDPYRRRADSGYAPDTNPRDAGPSMRHDRYQSNPDDFNLQSWNQSRGQDPSFDRRPARGSGGYDDYSQGRDPDPRASTTGRGSGPYYQDSGSNYPGGGSHYQAGRPDNQVGGPNYQAGMPNYQTGGSYNQAGGPTQRSSQDAYGYGAPLAPIGESKRSTVPRDEHARRFGNDQAGYSDTQGYGSTGMQFNSPYATTSNQAGTRTGTGAGTGGYAEQFLNSMPPPTSYDLQYGSSMGSSTTSDHCANCGKKAGKCNCTYVSNA